MPNIRAEHTGKYSLPKETFMATYRYALLYQSWAERMMALEDTARAIRYDTDRVQTSINGSPTEDIAIKRMMIAEKMKPIEDCAKIAGDDMWQWLLKGVTEEGTTYEYLRAHGLPCGSQQYYRRRRKFYWLLAYKLGY